MVEPTKGDEWTGGSKDIHVKRGKEDATVVLTARLEGKKSEDYASTAWAPFPYTTKVTKKNFRRRPDQLKTYEVNANCGIVNNVNQSSAQIFNPEAFRGPRKGWIEIQMVRPVNVTQSPTAVHNISSVTAGRQDDGTWHGRANCQTLVQPSPVSVSGQFEVLLQETLLELVDPRTED